MVAGRRLLAELRRQARLLSATAGWRVVRPAHVLDTPMAGIYGEWNRSHHLPTFPESEYCADPLARRLSAADIVANVVRRDLPLRDWRSLSECVTRFSSH